MPPRRLTGKQPALTPQMPLRRLTGKQPAPTPQLPTVAQQQHISDAALEAEAWAEITALGEDKQRQHIHYTHVHTSNPGDRQPESFTREEFYAHLERCYVDAYPERANRSESILLFGAVAKEAHAAGSDGHRNEHHHATTYCSRRHFWNKVAKVSYQKGRVKLNAVAHDGYVSMYTYITQPSRKKPLSELDQELYLSKDHPRGEALRKLLEAGSVHTRLQAARQKRSAAGSGPSWGMPPGGKRIRLGDVFGFVASQGVRSVLQIQSLACQASAQGDTRLAEFCTSMGDEKLRQAIDNAIAVLEAPQAMLDQAASRMELLRRAAVGSPCTCDGAWIPGAKWVLQNNHEDIAVFCKDVCRALEVGARRGTNMALVGAPGSGKSMLFEPFDGIYKVMGKPQSGSSFPLAGAIGATVLVWQDWKHDDKTVAFEDLLSFFVGELVDIRVPHQRNVSYRNTSPLFYTSNSSLQVARQDTVLMGRLNSAMAERFTTRVWRNPLPMHARVADFPRCSRCCAAFYLMHR